MASRGPLSRDWRGRFVAIVPVPIGPTPAQIIAHPTDRHPRYRLRVFDRCWPWRASQREAVRDAVLSGNARRDQEDRLIYLDACANIQRDPPHYAARFRRPTRSEGA